MSAVPAHSLYYDEPTYARLSAINKVVDPGRIFGIRRPWTVDSWL